MPFSEQAARLGSLLVGLRSSQVDPISTHASFGAMTGKLPSDQREKQIFVCADPDFGDEDVQVPRTGQVGCTKVGGAFK